MDSIQIKPIPDYPDYLCSTVGVVYSTKRSTTPVPLSITYHKTGYPRLKLCKDGKMKTFCVHRLMAMTFLADYSPELSVNHLDGVRDNNTIENLEMCTHRENIRHSFRSGRRDNRGENCNNSRLTNKQVLEIRELAITTDLTHEKIAEMYGVDRTNISKIISRQYWGHI